MELVSLGVPSLAALLRECSVHNRIALHPLSYAGRRAGSGWAVLGRRLMASSSSSPKKVNALPPDKGVGEQIRVEEQIRAVEDAIKDLEEEIKNLVITVKDVESKGTIEQDPAEKSYLRNKELALYERERLLRDKERLLREEKLRLLDKLPVTSPVGLSWEPDRQVEELVRHYSKTAVAARDVNRKSRTPELRSTAEDLGRNFEIVGRDEAFKAMLHGVGSMFRKFLHPQDYRLDNQRQGDSYFAMVAFPGAGKTTIGLRCREFLGACWNEWPDEQKQSLMGLPDGEYKLFCAMASESLRFNIHMFHTVAHSEGGVVESEVGLAAAQILALRCLFPILHNEDEGVSYQTFINDFDTRCPELKYHLTFASVLTFLRHALGLQPDQWIQPSFFFDELNAITKSLQGSSAGPGTPSWFQSVVSSFITVSYELARSRACTFPTVTLGTTRYTAGHLKFTESSKSFGRIIPLRPLLHEESRRVLLGFVNRLADSLGLAHVRRLGDWVEQHVIPVAGGMPRLLALGLASILDTDVWDAQQLFNYLTKDTIPQMQMKLIQDRWEYSLSRSYFTRYWHKPEMKILFVRALAASLLAVQVRRDELIHPEFPDVEENHWGSLEDAGLVSLLGEGSTTDLGAVPVMVKCCPFLVRHLAKALDWEQWPDVTTSSSRWKEKSDIQSLLLRAYLRDISYNQQSFKLEDVMPRGTMIPHRFQDLVFKLQHRIYTLKEKYVSKKAVQNISILHEEAGQFSALLGPGNYGADSFLLCEVVGPKKLLSQLQLKGRSTEIIFVFQSKQSTSTVSEVISNIENNFKRNIGMLFQLPGRSEAAAKAMRILPRRTQHSDGSDAPAAFTKRSRRTTRQAGPAAKASEPKNSSPHVEDDDDPGEYVYIFNTNKRISHKLRDKIKSGQKTDPYFSRIVFHFEEESTKCGDAISILAQLRRIKME